MVYKLDGGKVIDDNNNLFVENLYTGEITTFTIERGKTEGFTSGGLYSPPTVRYNTIDKFPFASDANATDHGDLFYAITVASSHSTATDGYTAAGANPSLPGGLYDNHHIQKFPFASNTGSSDVGDVVTGWSTDVAGTSSLSHGYIAGGNAPQYPEGGFGTDVIQKFQFSNSSNSVDIAGLTVGRYSAASQTSTTHGYTSGGWNPAAPYATPALVFTDIIDKFPFSSDANASDVGDLSLGRYDMQGGQSGEHGYTAGGVNPGNPLGTPVVKVIDRFPFASDGNAADIGDVYGETYEFATQSAQTHGYLSGGRTLANYLNIIQKYAFSNSANAADVGDLTQVRGNNMGHQV